MHEIWNTVKDKGVVVVGLNTAETGDPMRAAKGFQQKHGLTYPILVDGDQKVKARYRVNAFPTNLIIDANGVVRYVGEGYNERELKQKLDQVVRLTPPTIGPAEGAPGIVTVLLGGWKLDCENARAIPADRSDADLLWEQQSKSERHLVPLNGTKVANLGVMTEEQFNKLTSQNVPPTVSFTDSNVNGSDGSKTMEPGTVLLVQTRGERLVKIRIGAGDQAYIAQNDNPRFNVVLTMAACR